MAQYSHFVNLSADSTAYISDYRARVTASGVALLFAYTFNFVIQGYVTFVKNDQQKPAVQRKLLETSQVMYWFGVATIFSVFPPFYYGAFNAIISFLTLIILIMNHLFCFSDSRVKGRSVWAITYFLYFLFIVIWIIVGLILAYSWTNKVYAYS